MDKFREGVFFMRFNRVLSVIFALALVLFVLTASIALPIYIRPFYYAHIDAFGLPEYTGLTHDQMIGVVTAFSRGKREWKVTHPLYRLYCRFWHISRPLRHLWRRGIGWLRRHLA